ncbi:MAG: T9SS type A sorting domain-containing protein, partial [Flavobacteriales bacterium]
ICMQSSDATGYSSVACDTVIVGADGTINPTDPIPCLAGFWMVQAYGDTSDGGNFLAPIPYEVWVLGLSSAMDGIDTYVWDFGDGNTSTAVYPTHQYDSPGPYELCLTISNGSCSDTFCDTIGMDEAGLLNGMMIDGGHPIGSDNGARSGGFTLTVLQALPTAVAELPALVDLKLWPNPVQNELNVTLNSGYASKVTVTVIDLNGRIVLSMDRTLALGSDQIRLDTAPLEEGLYLLRLSSGTQNVTQRFLKVK